MEIKQYVIIESKHNEFTFEFRMPVGATLGAAQDALFEAHLKVIEMSKGALDKIKPAEENNDNKE